MTGQPVPDEFEDVLRRKLVVVATSQNSKLPENQQLTKVPEEVDAVRQWLCAEPLDRRVFEVPEDLEPLALSPRPEDLFTALRPHPFGYGDAVVMYVTGHGIVHDGAHWMVLRDAALDGPTIAKDGLRTADLIGWLRASDVAHALIVLDMCFAGKVVIETSAWDKPAPPGWAIVAIGARNETAKQCGFTGALQAALQELIAGTNPNASPLQPYLGNLFLDRVYRILHDTQRRRVEVIKRFEGSDVSPCLPNPAYRTVTTDAQYELSVPEAELLSHWSPRARGVRNDEDRALLFAGRARLLTELADAATGPPGCTVITGRAGCGKSAALAQLVVGRDPRFQQLHPTATPANTVASIFGDSTDEPATWHVDAAVVASDRTAEDIASQLLAALSGDASAPEELLGGVPPGAGLDHLVTACAQQLAERETPATLVIDGVDEATDPAQLVRGVLGGLAVGETSRRLRLLLGVRAPSIEGGQGDPLAVGGSGDSGAAGHVGGLLQLVLEATQQHAPRLVRADTAPYWDDDDLAHYVGRLLSEAVDTTTPVTDAAADAGELVAARCGKSFVLAGVAGRQLAATGKGGSVTEEDLGRLVADGLAGLFEQALDGYTSDDRRRALDLLGAVAWARGRGTPAGQVWPAIASGVAEAAGSPHAYGETDVEWLLQQPVAGYLMHALEDGVTVYRLFHDDMRHMIASMIGPESHVMHAAITRALLPLASRPTVPPTAYVRRYLPAHAAAGGMVDERLLTPEFLPYADVQALWNALEGAKADPPSPWRRVWTIADEHLDPLSPRLNAAVLDVVATAVGIGEQQRRRLGPAGGITRWSHRWLPDAPDRTITHAPTKVDQLTAVEDGAEALVIAVSVGSDPLTCCRLPMGTSVSLPVAVDRPASVAACSSPDGPLIAVGGSDGQVAVIAARAHAVLARTELGAGSVDPIDVMAHPDGRVLLATYTQEYGPAPMRLLRKWARVWEVNADKLVPASPEVSLPAKPRTLKLTVAGKSTLLLVDDTELSYVAGERVLRIVDIDQDQSRPFALDGPETELAVVTDGWPGADGTVTADYGSADSDGLVRFDLDGHIVARHEYPGLDESRGLRMVGVPAVLPVTGNIVVARGDGAVVTHDATTLAPLGASHPHGATCVTTTRVDGEPVVVTGGSADGAVRVLRDGAWEGATEPPPPAITDLIPLGSTRFVGVRDDRLVTVDAQDGRTLAEADWFFHGRPMGVLDMQVGQRVLAGGSGGVLNLVDPHTLANPQGHCSVWRDGISDCRKPTVLPDGPGRWLLAAAIKGPGESKAHVLRLWHVVDAGDDVPRVTPVRVHVPDDDDTSAAVDTDHDDVTSSILSLTLPDGLKSPQSIMLLRTPRARIAIVEGSKGSVAAWDLDALIAGSPPDEAAYAGLPGPHDPYTSWTHGVGLPAVTGVPEHPLVALITVSGLWVGRPASDDGRHFVTVSIPGGPQQACCVAAAAHDSTPLLLTGTETGDLRVFEPRADSLVERVRVRVGPRTRGVASVDDLVIVATDRGHVGLDLGRVLGR